MQKYLDIDNWNRKEHFEFFNQFDEPFFGIVDEVDITKAKNICKKNDISFFLYYHYQSIVAVNQIKEFRYRIINNKIVIFDIIHVTTTLSRADNTFSFSFIPFSKSFDEFYNSAKTTINNIKKTTGLGLNENTSRIDTVHFSTLPWISFKGVTHARSFKYKDSCPAITFGKFFQRDNKILMPISINVHHGLMDAFHVGQFLELFKQLMNKSL